jgi:CheY-like chemotaxis protein
MPGMDGFETARRLRTLDWGKQCIIIALTGYGQEQDKARTQAAGFDGHLVKPVDINLLNDLLTGLLDIKKD